MWRLIAFIIIRSMLIHYNIQSSGGNTAQNPDLGQTGEDRNSAVRFPYIFHRLRYAFWYRFALVEYFHRRLHLVYRRI